MDRAPSLLRLCTSLRTHRKPASEYMYAGVMLILFIPANAGVLLLTPFTPTYGTSIDLKLYCKNYQ